MSSLDPITMATQFATLDVQPFQQQNQKQATQFQTQLGAVGKVENALREFRSAIDAINKDNQSVIQNSVTFSDDGYLSTTTTAKALPGRYQVFVEQIATSHQISMTIPGNGNDSIPSFGSLTLSVNGKNLQLNLADIEKGDNGQPTMTTLVKAINNSSKNPGVNATLVRSNGQTHFMLTSSETGVNNSIEIQVSNTNQAGFENALNNPNILSSAQDAVIWLGSQGTGLKLTNPSNQFEDMIDGVDLTVTKAQKSGESPITLDIAIDKESTKAQVDSFIEAYNKLASTLDSYTQIGTDNRSRGVLASDPTIRSLKNELKLISRGQFQGMRLSQIGISLDRSGKMTLDQDKFEQAQRKNSVALEKVFQGEKGLFNSLDAILAPLLSFSSGLLNSRKETLRNSIERIEDKQETLERRYEISYQRYLKQFTQMNTLMTQMNQTMSMFG
ncbi:flagellar filament capping protein FliD [Vibrio sagamiensis]|uniref:Flagellar hook-associated protein 2 n=1 Tax=Vibrio sagamiensis NBRC 104589 TaxID=1219064 RepID=A0A511QD28_9VIBR|nr:flagellar filament capping protein FliD [Vibrio sagamiensis]PNQ64883.1 flagellar hook-associated protein [Vibrio agarivorans]GEM75193.1 lateral flagellar hook-associated protein 2 [Vibrio sagamiensis NBRC 104589]